MSSRVSVEGSGSPNFPQDRRDLRVFQSIRQIIRAVDLHSRQLLNKYKLTGPQLVCLLEIQKNGPITVGLIAKNIHLSPSTVIGVLDRLEAKKLIKRKRDKRDRRRVHVVLTKQGELLAENAPSPLQDKLAYALADLSESDQENIAEALERVVGLMQVDHIEAAPILETGVIDPTPTVITPATNTDTNKDEPLN